MFLGGKWCSMFVWKPSWKNGRQFDLLRETLINLPCLSNLNLLSNQNPWEQSRHIDLVASNLRLNSHRNYSPLWHPTNMERRSMNCGETRLFSYGMKYVKNIRSTYKPSKVFSKFLVWKTLFKYTFYNSGFTHLKGINKIWYQWECYLKRMVWDSYLSN